MYPLHVRRARFSLLFFGLTGAFALVAAGCGQDSKNTAGGGGTTQPNVITPADFRYEPVGEPGPGAFTPPVDTAPADDPVFGFRQHRARQATGGCDKEALKQELAARPAALAAWAEVEGIQQEQVLPYIDTLEPAFLANDTPVTNHGLNDSGEAYPVLSTLEGGTAVLVDKDESGKKGGPQPVTRCKCGNPLKPAPPVGSPRPKWVTTTTSYQTTTSYDDSTTTTWYDSTTSTWYDDSTTSTWYDDSTTTWYDDSTTTWYDDTSGGTSGDTTGGTSGDTTGGTSGDTTGDSSGGTTGDSSGGTTGDSSGGTTG